MNEEARPARFAGKRYVFLTSRVHPGEVGKPCLERRHPHDCNPHDPLGILLRENFVLKILPMLNPEGAPWPFRTDSRAAT